MNDLTQQIVAHHDLDVTRSVAAFRAADAAINVGAVLLAIGVVSLPLQGAMIQTGASLMRVEPGSHYYTWTVERWWLVAALQFAVVYPLWFFALASMRWRTALVIWVLMFLYMYAGVLLLQPPSFWRYAATNREFASGLIGNGVFYLVIFTLLLRAPLAARVLSGPQRHAARPLAPVRGYFDVLRSMFGVWPNLRRSLSSAMLSSVLIYAAIAVTTLNIMWRSVLFSIALFGAGLALFYAWLATDWSASAAANLDALAPFLIGAGVGAVGLAILYLPAALLQFCAQALRRQARKLSRQSLEAQIERDPRPPILFLRSFADDQVTLPKQGFWTRFLRGEPEERRLDHLLVENFSRYGPVVAIGRPSERDLPFGAARIYVGDDAWRDQVKTLADRAGHIVIVADPTPGVAWELETMLDQLLREKTLILAGPGQDVLANAFMKAWARQHTSMADSDSFLIALFSNHGALDALHVKKPSVDAYQVALQAFFRRAA